MTRLRAAVLPLIAVVGLIASAAPASAGWDNVFQVCCHDCKPRSTQSYFRADNCDPKPERRVEYQRSYYMEPVTVMKAERYTEEVPTQVKSYYWDPVTTYTYSSYYDACTGKCQQIACPKTSYVRKEQCNTVMRYVERTRMVPTQLQRKVEVIRPVVTLYYPEVRRYAPADCELPVGGAAPRVDEFRGSQPSVIQEGDMIPPTKLPISGGSRPRTAPAPTTTKPFTGGVNARTTSYAPATVRGEVVRNDQITPRGGTKLVFVSAANIDVREYVTSDSFGNFDVKLPAGEWHVYLGNGEGRAQYHKKISVGEYDAREFKVVSR